MSSYAPVRPTTTCRACGKTIDAEAVVCTGCGVMQPAARALDANRKLLPVFLLAFLLGPFGAHRFFVGKTGTAVLQLFTLGGMGLWVLYDLVVIITGNFTDKEGHKITEWV
jgi:predicted nucleic acid-binding Zn ribbon protein